MNKKKQEGVFVNVVTRKVCLNGLNPILFSRYPGNNKTELLPEQKFYFNENKEIILPVDNLYSFLYAQNTFSTARLLYGKGAKTISQQLMSFVSIEPEEINFTRDGKTPIVFDGFKKGEIIIHDDVARLKHGIPNPVQRPMLLLPWKLNFTIQIVEAESVNEGMVKNMFIKGGLIIGLGSYRGRYGKFEIEEWA